MFYVLPGLRALHIDLTIHTQNPGNSDFSDKVSYISDDFHISDDSDISNFSEISGVQELSENRKYRKCRKYRKIGFAGIIANIIGIIRIAGIPRILDNGPFDPVLSRQRHPSKLNISLRARVPGSPWIANMPRHRNLASY